LLLPVVVALLAGGVELYFGMRDYLTDTRILNHSSRTIGTVTEKRDSWNLDSTAYWVTYTFAPSNGESLTGKHDHLTWESWRDLKVGGPIEIAFDSADPTKNFPVARGIRPLSHIIIWTLVFSVGAFIGAYQLVRWLANRPTKPEGGRSQ
jgi:hypothetical protein